MTTIDADEMLRLAGWLDKYAQGKGYPAPDDAAALAVFLRQLADAKPVAWAIPSTGQFSWDKKDERYWHPLFTHAVHAVPATVWRPIESAQIEPFKKAEWFKPHSAKMLLCTALGGHIYIGNYGYTQRGKGRWRDSGGYIRAPQFWMPLPTAPAFPEASTDGVKGVAS